MGARHSGAEHRTDARRTRVMNQARDQFWRRFPKVKQVVSQVGRPDDGTDPTGFFNTEYFVDLKPKDQWRPVFRENKDELIAAMDREIGEAPRSSVEFFAADRRQHGRSRQRREGRAGYQIVR